MKNNTPTNPNASSINLKLQIPRINLPESSHPNYRNLKTKSNESTFKTSKSSHNVHNKNIDSTISVLNRQSSNIQLHNPQVIITIPPPVRPQHIYLKKQSVFSFDIISQYGKSFSEENIELKEHIKFLLKQIRKLKQLRVFDVNASSCSHNELFAKLTHELDAIRTQLKAKEEVLMTLKGKYDCTSKENKALKKTIKDKEGFDLSVLAIESKEHIEYDSSIRISGAEIGHEKGTGIEVNDFCSTSFSLNADKSNSNGNGSIVINAKPNNTLPSNTSTCYIKKTGLGAHRKKESDNTSTTISLITQPIIEKKLIMSQRYQCLYNLIPNCNEKKITVFNINTSHFSSIDYVSSTCSFDNKEESITLNVSNGMYILSGRDCNQFFHFDPSNNTIRQLDNAMYSHSKGAMILYTNYLSEEKLICLCSKAHTKVEMYNVNESTWSELPQLNSNPNSSLSRIETGYLLLNNHFLVAFYGYDCIKNEYIETIDYLSLTNPNKWDQIPLNITHTNMHLGCDNILMRSHTVFKVKNATNSESQYIYLLGGYNERGTNSSLIGINLKSDLTGYFPMPKSSSSSSSLSPIENEDNFTHSFSTPLYEYTERTQEFPYKKIIKYAFDTNTNIHIIDTSTLKHNILTYSHKGNWN